jgi:hypothetical protein
MRIPWAVAGIVAVSGCAPRYVEPWPQPIELPPEPPATVLRVPPDFTFREYSTGKQYFFRRYSATARSEAVRPDRLGRNASSITTLQEHGDVRLEVVTVIDAEGREERLATEQERAYALGVLQEDWVRRGQEEMLAYHRDVLERDRRMRADLLDERIQYTERAIADLKEKRLNLQADWVSSRETAGYKAPDGHLDWLDKEMKRTDARLLEENALLSMLRYERQLRNSRLSRSSALLYAQEWLPVGDLVKSGLAPERLIAEVKANVQPSSWKDPNVAIRYASGYLEIAHTRRAIEQTQEYLESVRSRRGK